MRSAFGLAVAALLAALAAGCASPGAVIPAPGYEPARGTPPRPDPAGILLLYNHGSRQEFQRDVCFPGSVTTPDWLRGFAGARIAGLPVSVYAFCTPTRTGDYHHRERGGRPKVEQRARDIEGAIARFVERGFDPGRIFLLGHSAGGWASLWALRDGEPAVGGVVAFAPAFAGPRWSRSPGWRWLHQQHVEQLRGAPRLPALVFTYAGDPFETGRTLAFMQEIPGVTLVELERGDCRDRPPHRAVFSRCVMDARQRERIRAFIARRLQGGDGALQSNPGSDRAAPHDLQAAQPRHRRTVRAAGRSAGDRG